MTRIGSLGSVASDQLSALRRLSAIGRDIATNRQRIATLRKLNSAADDPAGLATVVRIDRETVESHVDTTRLSRSSGLVTAAESAASEIVDQLERARDLVREVVEGNLSEEEVAARQAELDEIVATIDELADTSFGGTSLLNGSEGIRVLGIAPAKVVDVEVLRKEGAGDVNLDVTIVDQATRGSGQMTGIIAVGVATTLEIVGPRGSANVSIAFGLGADDVATAIDAVRDTTGLSATADGNDVDLLTLDYGSDTDFEINVVEGLLTLETTGTAGTDAVATINGTDVTADGTRFAYTDSAVSILLEIDPTAPTGAVAPLTVTGGGIGLGTGAPGLAPPDLQPGSLGDENGSAADVSSGGDHSLTTGDPASTLAVLEAALDDATRRRDALTGYRTAILDSRSRVLEVKLRELARVRSEIADADVAAETEQLARNQLLERNTLESLSVSSLANESVLELLQRTRP